LAASEELRMLQSSNIFDGDQSYYIMHGSDKQEPDKLGEGLGERWDVMTTAFKAYSACYLIFGVCDAAKKALGGRTVSPQDIDKIVVKGGEWITKRLSDPDPFGPVDAQFSTQWCTAMMIIGLPPGPRWCDSTALSSDAYRALARKVELEFDPVADQMWLENGKSLNEVRIYLKDGSVLTGAVDEPKGEPGNPFTEDEVRETFELLAVDSIGSAKAKDILQAVDDLETMADIGELVQLTVK
jgi:2-methylcitrate dehydratase PrpD